MRQDITFSNDWVAEEELIAELRAYRSQVEAIKQDARELATGMTDRQFNWRAQPGQWSIAECLDHLNVTGNLYLPVINRAIDQAHKQGILSQGPFHHGFLGNWFVRFTEPPPKRKIKAPRAFAPSAAKSLAGVVTEFMTLQDAFVRSIMQANGLNLAKVKVASPISNLIRLSLGQGFALMTAHERRHLWQAHQVKSNPNFP